MKIKSNAFALGGYAVPALLWATLFVQVVLFQWACYHNLLITSLWKSPDHFLVFWLSKIGIALFLASFALLSKRKWWTVAIVALVSLWCLSNLIYYRANNMVLSFAAITMAGNLSGFQSSILAYWNIHSTLFLLIPILYSLALIPLQAPTSRRPLLGAERYPWKGLGRNLLDTSSTRPFSEQEAYRWSDVLIRSNWFEDK